MNTNYIELDRTFRVLPPSEGDDPADEFAPGFGQSLTWADLLAERRVVLLSEAGSGKTEEIRHAAQKLRGENRAAFFMRLEFVAGGFETAFEEGSYEAFEIWLSSSEQGWLFLDSVDEARLKSPKDFEAAIRQLSARLKSAMARVHILITSRATAWRPTTDLQMCRQLLPIMVEASPVPSAESEDQVLLKSRGTEETADGFRVVTLADLTSDQVACFAAARQVPDPKALLDAIERADAWSFAARPQDLSELVVFWNRTQRIGSRLELMRASIDRRLQERDPDRSEARPLAKAKVVAAAKLLAGAATLTGRQTIEVPDARSAPGKGLSITSVLPDWDDADVAALLSRPIFDDEVYGTVRFHHRSVREYLAAEWVTGLLRRQTSRRRVEQLFFRVQYGMEVVIPTFRSILPWLIILDEGVRQRVARLAPEIFFEGGDPSQLPLATRQAILREVCAKIAAGAPRHAVGEYSSIQRFALPDIAGDVATLIEAYPENEDILWILLRMIWQGQLRSALPQALRIAYDPGAPKYVRIAAFRAVRATGTAADMEAIRASFAREPGKLRRDWLAELVSDAPRTETSVNWLVGCLRKLAARKAHSIDQMGEAVAAFIREADLCVLDYLLKLSGPLLNEPPVIERRYCEVSERFAWLLRPLALAVERLAYARDPATLSAAALDVFHKLPNADDFGRLNGSDFKVDLARVLAEWPELRIALFWRIAEQRRDDLATGKGERLTDAWPVLVVAPLLRFGDTDFDLVLAEVAARPALDDQMIALSLAFRLYVGAGRPRRWRDRLHKAARGAPELVAQLHGLLNPAPMSDRFRRMNKQQAGWKRRDAEREARQTKNKQQWREHLAANIAQLRSPALEPGVVTNAQIYLFQAMRGDGLSHNYSIADWHSLIPEFGVPVARAFRDGVVAGWRRYAPPTLSQGARANTIPYVAILGLIGLAIESTEAESWISGLTRDDVETAFRHAMFELNGLPPWLPQLFAAFPDQIRELALTEIEFELDHDDFEKDSHYLLYDINWSGQWLWEAIAPQLAERLVRKEPQNLRNLRYLLNILLGSSLPDNALADLAKPKALADSTDRSAMWFAAWVMVDPDAAVPALCQRIGGFPTKKKRLGFAMTFLIHLVGGRATEGFWRRDHRFRTADHLKALYLMAHTHVAERDDIRRAGTGVYSPGPRDDAQEARDTLFKWLKEIPGKKTFLAMLEIAQQHPSVSSRPWFDHNARTKAEADAAGGPWTADQVRDFNDALERVPTTHRELYDLALMRLLDLKADLEEGDSSEAAVLRLATQEVDVRKYLGNRLRSAANGRYAVPQEEELADAKRPDLRLHGIGFDGPVPIELKLADNWRGPDLPERLEKQLCGDYLRDSRSSLGVFVLIYRGKKRSWHISADGAALDFTALVKALEQHWASIAPNYPNVEEVSIVGIDLTRREQ